jgi:hypothetical protein
MHDCLLSVVHTDPSVGSEESQIVDTESGKVVGSGEAVLLTWLRSFSGRHAQPCLSVRSWPLAACRFDDILLI